MRSGVGLEFDVVSLLWVPLTLELGLAPASTRPIVACLEHPVSSE
jgi:hypothetical protein